MRKVPKGQRIDEKTPKKNRSVKRRGRATTRVKIKADLLSNDYYSVLELSWMVLRNFLPFKVDERDNVISFCNYPGGNF